MNEQKRRVVRFILVLVGTLATIAGIGAVGANAEVAKPGQKVNPPVPPIGGVFDRVTRCSPDGISIEIAKELKAIVGRDVYQKDKPIKGENGFTEHFLVFGVQVLFDLWLKQNPNKTVADAFKDPAFVKSVKDFVTRYDALVKAGTVKEPEQKFENGTLSIWCVDKGNGHGGPALAYYFEPPGKAGVWIGLCVFGDGHNKYYVQTEKDANNKDVVVKTQWMNYGKPDDSKDVYVLIYTYDVKTDTLTIEKKWGRWKKTGNTWDFGPPVNKQKDVTETIKPAPKGISDLKLEGESLLTACGCGNGDAVALADLPPELAEAIADAVATESALVDAVRVVAEPPLVVEPTTVDPTTEPTSTLAPTDTPTPTPTSTEPATCVADPTPGPTPTLTPPSEPTIEPTAPPTTGPTAVPTATSRAALIR